MGSFKMNISLLNNLNEYLKNKVITTITDKMSGLQCFTFYYFINNNWYCSIKPNQLHKWILEYLIQENKDISDNEYHSMVQNLKFLLYKENIQSLLEKNYHLILFQNGVFDITTKVLRPIQHSDFVLEKLEMNYCKYNYDENSNLNKILDIAFPDKSVKKQFLNVISNSIDRIKSPKTPTFIKMPYSWISFFLDLISYSFQDYCETIMMSSFNPNNQFPMLVNLCWDSEYKLISDKKKAMNIIYDCKNNFSMSNVIVWVPDNTNLSLIDEYKLEIIDISYIKSFSNTFSSQIPSIREEFVNLIIHDYIHKDSKNDIIDIPLETINTMKEDYKSEDDSDYNNEEESGEDSDDSDLNSDISEDEIADIQRETNMILSNE